jgi:ABC-type Fe3+/spermidine/putrescine transport system ATPase subunit
MNAMVKITPGQADAPRDVPPAVTVSEISRDFDGVRVLDAVSLQIRQGEFFSLLGPSGCGKTTLLRIIGGFERPSSGDLLINGRSVAEQPPYLRRTNMVFQDGALFPHLTVEQNIAFGLEMKRVAAQETKKRTAEALDMVRLGGYGHRRIDQLSGGQRQRVALARALVNKPEVLLLDEPLSALDLQLRLQMQDELRRLQRETGATFIFVTHDQGEAITMSDRLAVMQSGKILQVGTPREVYERPGSQFVAQFMGHSNFLWGTLVKRDGTMASVQCDGIELSGRLAQDAPIGQRVMVALRYEKVIDEIYMGATIRRQVQIGNNLTIVSESANAANAPLLVPGSPVDLSWASDAACVLFQ